MHLKFYKIVDILQILDAIWIQVYSNESKYL